MFKQRGAYEIGVRLVGSEMSIRGRSIVKVSVQVQRKGVASKQEASLVRASAQCRPH